MAKDKGRKDTAEKRGLVHKIKGVGSELKKVSWPSFKTTLKNTGVVLLVVAVFLVIILAFDLILRFGIFNFLIMGQNITIINIANSVSNFFSSTANFALNIFSRLF